MASLDISGVIERQHLSRFLVNLLAWLSLIMFFDGYNTQAISYAAPAMAHAWGLERGAFGLVFSMGFAGAFAGGLVAGVLADRIGRKPTIIAAAFMFSTFTIGTALTQNITQLCVLRFLCGFAIGAMVPPAIALSVEFAPQRFRATFATIVTVGYMLGTSAGGVIARLFMEGDRWHVIFLFGGCLSLLISVALIFALSESLTFMVGRGCEPARIWKVLRRVDAGIKPSHADEFVLGGQRGTAAADADGSIRPLFKGRLVWVTLTLCLSVFISSWEANCLLNWMPTLAEGKGVEAHDAVLTLTYYILAGTLGSLLLMRFIDRFGPVSIVVMPLCASPLIAAIGYLPLAPVTCVTLLTAVGLFIQGGHFGLSAMMGVSFPGAYRASGYAVCASAGRLGGSIGPYFGGLMLLHHLPLPAIFAVYAAIPLLLAAAIFLFTTRYRRMRQLEADAASRAAPA